MMKTMGNFCTEAKFRASWNGPVLVAPSPILAITMVERLRIFIVSATPHATGSDSPACRSLVRCHGACSRYVSGHHVRGLASYHEPAIESLLRVAKLHALDACQDRGVVAR